MGKYLTTKEAAAPAATVSATVDAAGCLKELEALLEYMTLERWEGGGAREPATVTVFFEGGGLRLALNDRAMRRSMYVTAGTVEAGLRALDKALRSSSGDWRAWKGSAKKS